MGCPAIDIANPKGASRAIPAPARRASARGPVSLRRTKEKRHRYGWTASSGSYVANDPVNLIDPDGMLYYANGESGCTSNCFGGEEGMGFFVAPPEGGGQDLAGDARREISESRILDRCGDNVQCVRSETEALNEQDAEVAGIQLSLITGVFGRGAAAAAAGARFSATVDDVLANPGLLAGRSLDEVSGALGSSRGWAVEALRQGSRRGQGWVLRQYGQNGIPTGRMIRFHLGGGHHGARPYWRVTSGENGNVGPIWGR